MPKKEFYLDWNIHTGDWWNGDADIPDKAKELIKKELQKRKKRKW